MYQTKQRVLRSFSILTTEGPIALINRLKTACKKALGLEYLGNFDSGYKQWRLKHDICLQDQAAETAIQSLKEKPLVSIIMPIYRVELKWLQAAVNSVYVQNYENWELCLVDDASEDPGIAAYLENLSRQDDRIKAGINQSNFGIAKTSNNALGMAHGEFIGFMDHDDLLRKDALLQNVLAINNQPDIDIIYSDEDKITINGEHSTPFFKPDYCPHLLLSHNYIGHFVVIRKSLVDEIGGFKKGLDGAQDYDLLLRAVAKTSRIKHIPKILYHWRKIPGSTASCFDSKSYAWEAGRRALQDCLCEKQQGYGIENGRHAGTYKLTFDFEAYLKPSIGVIIPFKDQSQLLDKCLTRVFENSDWQELEVLAINNNSINPETDDVIEKWQIKESRFKCIHYDQPFNFSAICNFGVANTSAEYVVLLNNDIEILTTDWIEPLLTYAQQPNVGAVGAKLLYPNNTVQHAGIVMGIEGGAGHAFKHFPASHKGYFMRLDIAHNVSAVTAALLMVSRKKYLKVGGFGEEDFAIAYNDVDFCLKLQEHGCHNVLNPYCLAIHHESSSRGVDMAGEKQIRHDKEKQALAKKWKMVLQNGDPCYNPNLTSRREDYSMEYKYRQNREREVELIYKSIG